VRATGKMSPPEIHPMPEYGQDASEALIDFRPVVLSGVPQHVPFFRGEMLRPGNVLAGPALVIRSDTTILLPEATESKVDLYGNLIVDLV
jgi:N-methylhydantoinase A